MALARFSDVINIYDPVKVGGMSLEQFPERSAFSQAGIYARDPMYDQLVAGPGFTYQMQYWDFDRQDSTPVNDNPADEIQPQGLTSHGSTAASTYAAMDYGIMQVIREPSLLSDPLAQIATFDSTVWAAEIDRFSLGVLRTALEVGETANAGRYILDLANEDGNAANDANRISPEATLDALHLSKLNWADKGVIVMSHRVFLRLQKLNLIDVVADSDQKVRFSTYLGLRVVLVEDRFLDRAGTTSGTVSDVLIINPGAIMLGLAKPTSVAPSVFVTNEKAGFGSASTEWITRQKWMIGLRHISWTGALNHYPSYDEYTNPANWTLDDVPFADDLEMGVVAMRVNV